MKFCFQSIYSIVEPILKTFKLFFFTINQWVLFIPGSYFGFSLGFIIAELTRAYASCILGVGSVSMCCCFLCERVAF